MARNIVHSGGGDDVILYTNGNVADLQAGEIVVMSHTLGVALEDIPKLASGNVAVGGIVGPVPKVEGAEFVVGEKLVYDVSEGAFDDSSAPPAAGDITGAAIAVRPGANGELDCYVKLTPGNADVAAGGD